MLIKFIPDYSVQVLVFICMNAFIYNSILPPLYRAFIFVIFESLSPPWNTIKNTKSSQFSFKNAR